MDTVLKKMLQLLPHKLYLTLSCAVPCLGQKQMSSFCPIKSFCPTTSSDVSLRKTTYVSRKPTYML